MKSLTKLALLALLFLGLSFSTSLVHAQGSLTPSGAPAPTMKSLAQIEPRTPISSLPFGIGTSGSYYLTTNLTGVAGSDGIQIAANDVTIDLNGFTVTGDPASFFSVALFGAFTNICIKNGTFKNWPSGIEASLATGCQFKDLRFIRAGTPALNAGAAAIVENCSVFNSGGMWAGDGSRFTGCLAISNATTAIGNVNRSQIIERCVARNNNATGFSVGQNSRVNDCVSENNVGGYFIGLGGVVEGCIANGNKSSGFAIVGQVKIFNSIAISNQVYGIQLGASSSAKGCIANYNLNHGYNLANNSAIEECVAIGNTGDGAFVSGNTTVKNCVLRTNTQYGVEFNSNSQGLVSDSVIEFNLNGGCYIINSSVLTGNTVRSNGVLAGLGGFLVTGRGNRVENNTFIGNTGNGIHANFVTSLNNLILRNTGTDNSAGNFNINATNHFVIATGGNLATNLNPYVNFSH